MQLRSAADCGVSFTTVERDQYRIDCEFDTKEQAKALLT